MELGSSRGAQWARRCGGTGARESCCTRADVEVWSSGALEACRRRGLEVWSSGAREARSGRVGVCLELGSSGVVLQACRRGGRSSGALEACYTCRDVEEFASRALEMRCRLCLFVSRDLEIWRRAARVGTCRRHRGMELWSGGGALQACRRGDVEVWRSGALKACCACRDVEEAQRYRSCRDALLDILVWRSGALEALCRRCLKRGMEHWASSELFVVGISSFRSSRPWLPRGLRRSSALYTYPAVP